MTIIEMYEGGFITMYEACRKIIGDLNYGNYDQTLSNIPKKFLGFVIAMADRHEQSGFGGKLDKEKVSLVRQWCESHQEEAWASMKEG